MYLAVVAVPLSFLILVLEITHTLKWLSKERLALLMLEPVVMLIAVWTNDLHHQFIARFSSFAQDGLIYMEFQRGPLYWINVFYSYSLLLVCMVLLVRTFARTAPLFRRQLSAFMLGASLPWLGNIAMLAGLLPFRGLDITPIVFGVTALIFYFTLSSRLRFNLLPVARSLILQVLSDGLVVADANFTYLDVNPAAERILGISARDLIGREAFQVFPEWKEFLGRLSEHPEEINVQIQGRQNPARHFDLKVTPITNEETVTGYLILFRDITDRWQAEQQVRQANLELQARFNEIEALQQELRTQATRDPLTNLYNRRYLEETLENELARAEREGNFVSIIMLDADKFKRINDLHGHKAGDLALQALARIIHLYIRKSDIACRYGGEEFVIVMPNTGMEVARDRAEKIREDFHRVNFIGPGTEWETSLSIGIAAYPISGTRRRGCAGCRRPGHVCRQDGRRKPQQAASRAGEEAHAGQIRFVPETGAKTQAGLTPRH